MRSGGWKKARALPGSCSSLDLAGALWAASGYIGAFIRAANVIWDVPEGRPIWKTVPLRLAITVVTVLLLAVSAVAVVVTGPLAEKVGRLIGVGGLAVTIWDVAKWPVLIVIVSFLFAILYYAAPNVRQPGFRWITPGGVLAILLWMIASAAFALYVAKFGSYNKTYARWAEQSSSSSGCGFPTSPCCSAPNSTPNSRVGARSRRVTRRKKSRSFRPETNRSSARTINRSRPVYAARVGWIPAERSNTQTASFSGRNSGASGEKRPVGRVGSASD